jgi:hypothetical protein
VKLLVDENLSPTLVSMLSDLFSGSEHAYRAGRRHHAGARRAALAAAADGSFLRRLSPRWTTARVRFCSTRTISKEIRRARIASRTEHAMQTLAGFVERCGKALEADRGVHQVTKHRLSADRVARKIGVHRFGEEGLSIPGVMPGSSLNGLFEVACQCHAVSYADVRLLRRR